jgi:hypothetical protein
VYELFGGPVRTRFPVYWSHCGTYRVRNHLDIGMPRSIDQQAGRQNAHAAPPIREAASQPQRDEPSEHAGLTRKPTVSGPTPARLNK